MTNDRALVLGAQGFIGTAVCAALERKGYKVDQRSLRTGPDLRNLEATRESFDWLQPKIIFNCAAHVGSMAYIRTNPALIYDDNCRIASNLYRAVSDVCDGEVTIVNPLSNCSYPGDREVQIESEWLDGPPHPSVAPYAYAKRHIHVLSHAYGARIRSINLILPNAFGPGDHLNSARTHALDGLIMRMILARRVGAPEFKVWGTGKPVREWGYITDMAEVLARAPQLYGTFWKPINVAQSNGWSIARSAEEIKEIVRYSGDIVFEGDVSHDGDPRKILHAARFRKFFPNFTFTDHIEGLRQTVEYYERALT